MKPLRWIGFPVFIFFQINLKGDYMILYFTSALVLGYALIQLGSYATVIAMISTASKVAVALLSVAALIMLVRKYAQRN